MRWTQGVACALVIAAGTALVPTALAQTVEACRDGDRESAQAVDDDIRIVDDDGWYYLMASGGASSWKESNDVAGLQTERRTCDVSEIDGESMDLLYSYVKWEPDTLIAGAAVSTSGFSAQTCICVI